MNNFILMNEYGYMYKWVFLNAYQYEWICFVEFAAGRNSVRLRDGAILCTVLTFIHLFQVLSNPTEDNLRTRKFTLKLRFIFNEFASVHRLSRPMCITCTFSVSNHLQFRFDSQPQRLPVASAAISISVRLEIFAKSKIIWINWAWFWTGACGNGNGDAAEPRQTGVGTAMYKNRKFRKDIYNLAWMEGKKWSGPWRSNLIQ